MRNDWEQLRDKGPPIEEPNKRHKTNLPKRKYVLETRYVGPRKAYFTEYWEKKREWHVHKKYRTEAARQDAYLKLIHRSHNSYEIYRWFEFRIPEDG